MRTWALFAAVAAVLLVQPAPGAQEGSERSGYTHPETEVVTDADGTLPNPFGRHVHDDYGADVEGKLAFAERVDLEPLRSLAVFHNGRVKILDTLARESVRTLTGRADYYDLVDVGSERGDMRRARYDPLFTLLDMMVDPHHYVDGPLIHVTYLPLRRAILDAEFGDDAAAIDRWLRKGRVSPAMIDRHATAIFNRFAHDEPFREGIQRAEHARNLFWHGAGNLLLISPRDRRDPWRHVSEWPEESGVRAAFLRLGSAWRAHDAEGVSAAAADIAGILPAINPETYPDARRDLELAYNNAGAFERGFWAYLVSFVLLILAFGTGRRWLAIAGIVALTVAIGLHGFGFVARCIIAERFAIQNQFESMIGLSLFATVVGLAIMLVRRQWLFGAAAAGTGFLVLVTATQTGIPGVNIEREAAILNTSVLLKYHVTTVLTSYGLIALGFICSLFYLATHYGAKISGRDSAQVALASGALTMDGEAQERPRGVARTLADLDTAQMTVLQLAFWTLGVGILLGAWWADHSWGRWWAFDPKETWALVTWIVYLIVIHVRFAGVRNRAVVTAWLSVVGFFVMLWTYFGVNLLLPGLHAYA